MNALHKCEQMMQLHSSSSSNHVSACQYFSNGQHSPDYYFWHKLWMYHSCGDDVTLSILI